MTAAEERDKLRRLHADGLITDEQYARACAKLDDEDARADEERRPRRRARADYDRRSRRERRKQVRELCTLLHLSLLFGHVVALGGIVAPIVIWQTKRAEFPEIDAHGKNVVNWLITWLLYMLVSLVLVFVLIGIPLLIVGAVVGVVFPILGAIKANDGRVWRYPLALPFLR